MAAYLVDRSRSVAPRSLHRLAQSLDLLQRYLVESRPRHRWTTVDLSRGLLSDWWAWLRSPETGRHGRQRTESTCRLHIEAVQGGKGLWPWAWDHDDYGEDTPRPRKIDLPRRPVPQPAAPSWHETDAMLRQLQTGQKAADRADLYRLALLARYTGARREALLLLEWGDVDLSDRLLTFRAETTKGGHGGRTVPLHPALAEDMAGWGARDGYVLGDRIGGTDGKSAHLGRTLSRAWRRTGIPERVWRGHPLHCLRAGLRTHLVATGTQGDVIDALLGHALKGTGGRHYTDRSDPRLWEQMTAAVGTVPAVGASNVEPLRRRGGEG